MSRILLVESSDFLRQRHKNLLINSGYDVIGVRSAPVAYQMLDDNEIFDLIIIDANLQGVDGVSVLRNIKATRPKQKIAIISADDINAIENKACNQGALAIFSKPLNEDNITALIETANI